MRKVFIALFILLVALVLFIGWFLFFSRPTSKYGVKALSISSDGRYIVGNKQTDLYLWDVESRTKQRVAKNVNIYSAYFIKNTHYYMYQDLKNVVHIRSLNGQEVKTISLDFATYGHLMTTDLSRYFASDIGYRIVKIENGEQSIVKGLDQANGFFGGKLLNLSLSSDDNLILAAGEASGGREPSGKTIFINDEITSLMKWPHHASRLSLWDAQTNAPRIVFTNLSNKQCAVLSPDMQYLIAADEGGKVSIIDMETNEYITFRDHYSGVAILTDDNSLSRIEVPKGFYPLDADERLNRYTVAALRLLFITPTEYIKFNAHSPFAFLYTIDNVVPLAYFNLGTEPYPSVHDYSRNASIDTAPAAHRVVIGKHSQPGIMVYDYDPEAKTLTKIWDSK